MIISCNEYLPKTFRLLSLQHPKQLPSLLPLSFSGPSFPPTRSAQVQSSTLSPLRTNSRHSSRVHQNIGVRLEDHHVLPRVKKNVSRCHRLRRVNQDYDRTEARKYSLPLVD